MLIKPCILILQHLNDLKLFFLFKLLQNEFEDDEEALFEMELSAPPFPSSAQQQPQQQPVRGNTSKQTILRDYFGFDHLRPLQENVVNACMAGRDCFVRATTGSGKSLCYQLPPLLQNKPGVVISPLISLMEDQVNSLKQANISACALTSSCPDQKVFQNAREGKYSLVYMSPERFERWQDGIQDLLNNVGISLFAVDEAHCISEWGHDFRGSYRTLHLLRANFPSIPIMALTATATPRVQSDIVKSLRLNQPLMAIAGLDRTNLRFSAKEKRVVELDLSRELFQDLLDADTPGSCIVYCLSRKMTEEIATHLRSIGLKARAYHAGLRPADRQKVHEDFSFDAIQVVVATLAFGMGIDKPDITMVVHYGMPKTIEAYFQQTGRAGRDGSQAKCILFWANADLGLSNFYMKNLVTGESKRDFQKMSAAMEQYSKSAECRRKFLLRYFGEEYPHENCSACDNCNTQSSFRDFTREARWFAKALWDVKEKFGANVVVGVLKGSQTSVLRSKEYMFRCKMDNMDAYGSLRDLSVHYVKGLVMLFLTQGVIQDHFVGKGGQIKVYRLGPKGKKLLNDPSYVLPKIKIPSYLIQHMPPKRNAAVSIGASSTQNSPSEMPKDERDLQESLLKLRTEIAHGKNCAPYMVLSKISLDYMAKYRPIDPEHIKMVPGVGAQKAADYGSRFAHAIFVFSRSRGLETNLLQPNPTSAQSASDNNNSGWVKKLEGNTLSGSLRRRNMRNNSTAASENQVHISTVAANSSGNVTTPFCSASQSESLVCHGKPVQNLVSHRQRPVATNRASLLERAVARKGIVNASIQQKILSLFLNGSDRVWIAKAHKIRKATIEEALANALEVDEEEEIDWDRLGVAETTLKAVRKAFAELKATSSSSSSIGGGRGETNRRGWLYFSDEMTRVKRKVDADIAYSHIRFVQALLTRERIVRQRQLNHHQGGRHNTNQANVAPCIIDDLGRFCYDGKTVEPAKAVAAAAAAAAGNGGGAAQVRTAGSSRKRYVIDYTTGCKGASGSSNVLVSSQYGSSKRRVKRSQSSNMREAWLQETPAKQPRIGETSDEKTGYGTGGGQDGSSGSVDGGLSFGGGGYIDEIADEDFDVIDLSQYEDVDNVSRPTNSKQHTSQCVNNMKLDTPTAEENTGPNSDKIEPAEVKSDPKPLSRVEIAVWKLFQVEKLTIAEIQQVRLLRPTQVYTLLARCVLAGKPIERQWGRMGIKKPIASTIERFLEQKALRDRNSGVGLSAEQFAARTQWVRQQLKSDFENYGEFKMPSTEQIVLVTRLWERESVSGSRIRQTHAEDDKPERQQKHVRSQHFTTKQRNGPADAKQILLKPTCSRNSGEFGVGEGKVKEPMATIPPTASYNDIDNSLDASLDLDLGLINATTDNIIDDSLAVARPHRHQHSIGRTVPSTFGSNAESWQLNSCEENSIVKRVDSDVDNKLVKRADTNSLSTFFSGNTSGTGVQNPEDKDDDGIPDTPQPSACEVNEAVICETAEPVVAETQPETTDDDLWNSQ